MTSTIKRFNARVKMSVCSARAAACDNTGVDLQSSVSALPARLIFRASTYIVKAIKEPKRPSTLSVWLDGDVVCIAVTSAAAHAHLGNCCRLLLDHFGSGRHTHALMFIVLAETLVSRSSLPKNRPTIIGMRLKQWSWTEKESGFEGVERSAHGSFIYIPFAAHLDSLP